MTEVKLHESWKKALSEEFGKAYFSELSQFVRQEISSGQIVYPHPKNIFAALDKTPFEDVKVIIL
jgi:uracil-DNA glycosylase